MDILEAQQIKLGDLLRKDGAIKKLIKHNSASIQNSISVDQKHTRNTNGD